MNIIQQASPGYTPDYVARRTNLFILRERILQSIYLVIAVLGIPTIILASLSSIRIGDTFLAFAYIGVYLLFLGMAFARKFSFNLRGILLILVIYLLGLSELIESGQLGDLRMFLIAFCSLTAVLFNYRSVILTVVIGLVSIAAAGIYATSAPDLIFPAMAHIREGTDWITASASFLLITGTLSGAISLIISGLSKNLARQAELAKNLAQERTALEQHIQERTHSITRRLDQLHAASEISHAISGLNDPEHLLQQVIDLVKGHFDLYYVGVFLLDPSRQLAVLQAGTGEAGKRMLAQGHKLSVSGSSMIGWAVTNRKARIALDVGTEAVRFNNPNLPLTRSELALPIIAHDVVLGAITIQSEIPNAFDEEDMTILESVADSLAVALENDRLYQEARRGLEEIRALNRDYLQQSWNNAQTQGTLAYEFTNTRVPEPVQPEKTLEIPLILRDETIGYISLERDFKSLTEEENNFIKNVSIQTAIALENARLLQETERRALQEQKLNELTNSFTRAITMDEILRAAAQTIGQLPAVAEVSVQINPANFVQQAAELGLPSNGKNGKEIGR